MNRLPAHVWYGVFTGFALAFLFGSIGFVVGILVADWYR